MQSTPSTVLSPAASAAVMEKYTPKNILITGGAGFIASHVAIRLVKNYGQYKCVAEKVRPLFFLSRQHLLVTHVLKNAELLYWTSWTIAPPRTT